MKYPARINQLEQHIKAISSAARRVVDIKDDIEKLGMANGHIWLYYEYQGGSRGYHKLTETPPSVMSELDRKLRHQLLDAEKALEALTTQTI